MASFYHSDLQEAQEIELSPEESQHLAKTLRGKVGDTITLFDGCGTKAQATILALPQRRGPVVCQITTCENIPRPDYRIHLYVAPPRNKLLPQVVRQAVELGVSDIHLIESDFSVVKGKGHENLQKDILNACKQSGNAYFTEIHPMLSFNDALAECTEDIYFGAVPTDPNIDPKRHQFPSELAIWIGPEGGFSEKEKQALIDKDAKGICLGKWILRVETAVVALISKVL